jgi:hypothetical protein
VERLPIDSTQISSMGYNPLTGDLEVQFRNGTKVGQYSGVTQDEWRLLQESKSKGQFLNQVIKPIKSFTYL